MRFTVFTPTYNRMHTLERLYQSLQRQSFKDFEWIVIDDGSTDGTEEWFAKLLQEDDFFAITYQKVENGGKHRAINKAVKMAVGELFFIADSDDYLTNDALETVDRIEKTIPQESKARFAGVCGLDIYMSGELVGTTYEGDDFLDITSLQTAEKGISGDKKEVFYTSILAQFPFPEFPGEKFVAEALIWRRIANEGYMLRYFNIPIYVVEYQSTGISNNYDVIQGKSPRAWALFIRENAEHGLLKGRNLRQSRVWYYKYLRNTLAIQKICEYLDITVVLLIVDIVQEQISGALRRIMRYK